MTDRELLQQALDYIKETYDFCVVMQQPKEREEQLMKSLEVALAQPEPIQVRPAEFAAAVSVGVGSDFIGTPMIWAEWPTPKPAIVRWSIPVDPNNFGKPLAQPEQSKYSDIVSDGGLDPRNKFDAQPEQEPWLWINKKSSGVWISHQLPIDPENWHAVYKAPTKRQWVGLTQDEKTAICMQAEFSDLTERQMYDVVEAKLRSKNEL